MSIPKRNETGQKTYVIGRAYGDEPIKLIPVADWGSAVEVRREGDRDSVGFRKEAIYRFDRDLFESLCSAFASKDRRTLARLWNRAEREP